MTKFSKAFIVIFTSYKRYVYTIFTPHSKTAVRLADADISIFICRQVHCQDKNFYIFLLFNFILLAHCPEMFTNISSSFKSNIPICFVYFSTSVTCGQLSTRRYFDCDPTPLERMKKLGKSAILRGLMCLCSVRHLAEANCQ